MKHDRYTGNWFPAPREVDRYLYNYYERTFERAWIQFPATLEVDRCPIPHFDYGAVDCY